MNCPNCNNEIPDNVAFCPSCGKALTERNKSKFKHSKLSKKKKICIVVAVILLLIIFATNVDRCEHEYSDATCDTPQICKLCGDEGDKALGHIWVDADCSSPKTCSYCGLTEGEKLEHDWQNATCTSPKTCSLCEETEGKKLGHDVNDWKTITASTCTDEGTKEGVCSRCSETVTEVLEKLEHKPGKWKISEKAEIGKSGKKIKRCKTCNEIVDEKSYSVSTAEYKNNCKSYSYDTIARNPNKYKGEYGKFYGKVIQVMEEPFLSYTSYTLRIALNGNYDQVILVTYWADEDEDHILEDDYVNVYGEIQGTKTYETVMGNEITIPYVDAEILEIK